MRVNDDREKGNVFTHSAEESYNVGYNGVKAVERVVDIVSVVKGGVKLAKSVGDMSKSPSSVHGDSLLESLLVETENLRPTPYDSRWIWPRWRSLCRDLRIG